MHHLFISDVHFGAFSCNKQHEIENSLVTLIEFCEENSIYLHVLGDLFDYWMEFENYIPDLGFRILERFEAYHQKMGKTLFITGNHDYWTLGYFENKGFEVHHEYALYKLDGNRVFLAHGDGISEKKYHLSRPLMNKLLRNKNFVALYRSLFSGKRANYIMKRFSDFTRDPYDLDPEKLNNWAKKLIKKYNFDAVISGHDHVPRIETFYGHCYINTGAFHNNFTLAQYNNGKFGLVNWNSKSLTIENRLNTSVTAKI